MTTLSPTDRLPTGHPVDTLTERQFQGTVEDMARALGWRIYHTHDSRRSAPGFPDLVMIHVRQKRTLWRELKTARGRVSPSQREWLADLLAAREDAAVWRPTDLASGRILAELRGDATPHG